MLTLTGVTLPAVADEAEDRGTAGESVSDVDAALLEYLGSWDSSDEEWLWLDGDEPLDAPLDDREAAEDEETAADGRPHPQTEPGAAEGREQ